MHVLKREAARFEAERIATGTALGEVDHPSYNSRYFRSLNRESCLIVTDPGLLPPGYCTKWLTLLHFVLTFSGQCEPPSARYSMGRRSTLG